MLSPVSKENPVKIARIGISSASATAAMAAASTFIVRERQKVHTKPIRLATRVAYGSVSEVASSRTAKTFDVFRAVSETDPPVFAAKTAVARNVAIPPTVASPVSERYAMNRESL